MTRSMFAIAALALAWGCADTDEPVASSEGSLTLKTNYALGKPTSQSSTAFGGDSSRAVDGNTSGVWANNSVTHTDLQANAWWQVDLLQSRYVDTVQIFGRTDSCCTSRLGDYWVLVSPTPISNSLATALNDPNVTKQFVSGTSQLPSQAVGIYANGRYVRIVLAHNNYLSLAEVQVLDAPNEIVGPDAIATKTSWTATGVVTSSSAFALVEASNSLRSYQRGANGLLQESIDFAAPHDVPGSPAITTDGISAITSSGHTFVVARGTNGNLEVADHVLASDTWTWRELWATDGPPAVAVACGKVYVSSRYQQALNVFTRPVDGTDWAVPSYFSGVRSPPALAASPTGDIGLAYISTNNWIYFSRGYCSGGGTLGSPVSPGGTSLSSSPVGLVAYSNLFGVAVRGTDNLPYVALQSYDANNMPIWSGFEPVESSVALTEAPTLVIYRGLIYMAARDTSNQLRYWIRNPNFQMRQSGEQTWLGGRIVSGWGTGATPPAFAIRGSYENGDNYGYVEKPDGELYVATKGIGDQQLYALNFGRFSTWDILSGVFGIQFNTNFEANGVDPRTLGDFPDFLPGFMQVPSRYWSALSHPSVCNPVAPLTIAMITNVVAGHTFVGCGPYTYADGRVVQMPNVQLFAKSYPSWTLWEELGHMTQNAVAGFKSQAGYNALFGALMPRACTTNADCGGGWCMPACVDGTRCPSGAEAYPNSNRCQNFGYGFDSIRPMGYVDWYDVTQDEHSFLDFVEWYRWWGDELREMRDQDLAEGNTMLRDKYNWVKTNYYNGVEFRGRHAGLSTGNRSAGTFGFPMK